MNLETTKRFFLTLILISGIVLGWQQTIAQNILFSESFQNLTLPDLPAGWTAIDNDGKTPYANDQNITYIGTAGWVSYEDNGDTAAAAHSWYTPPAASDDWLISPSITLGNNSFLKWRGRSLGDASFLEEYEVRISTTTPDINGFLANPALLKVVNEPNSAYTEHTVSLSAYAGQQVYIAFWENSNDQYIILIDDILVFEPTADDGAITAFTAPLTNGCTLSNSEAVSVTINNIGANAMSNFSVSYSVNGGTPVTETVAGPINPGNSLTHTFFATINLSTPNQYQITSYISGVAGDANAANDTLRKNITSAVPHDFNTNPFQMGFEPNEDLGAWKIGEDLNGNNQSWVLNFSGQSNPANSGSQFVAIVANTLGTNNNDWFFTPCLSLETGKSYRLEFYLRVGGSRKMKIMLGSNQNAAGMTQTIADEPNLASSGGQYNGMSYTFTVSATGTYYIGFQDSSDVDTNFPRLAVDDINIYPLAPTDAATIGFASPSTGTCSLSNAETVQLGIYNAGTSPISNFSVSYTINGGAPVTETVTNTIDPDSVLVYSFTAKADLSVAGNFDIVAYATLTGDPYNWNDTSSTSVISIATINVPPAVYTQGFEQGDNLDGWTIGDIGNDGSWFISNIVGNNSQQSIQYDSDPTKAANDWLYTSCFNLQTGKTYALSFFAQVENSAINTHDLEVFIGASPEPAMVTQGQLITSQALADNPFAEYTSTFTVAASGIYYIGFHVVSVANMSYLALDDVKLTDVTAIPEQLSLDAFIQVQPNPSRGKFVITNNLSSRDDMQVEVLNVIGQTVAAYHFGKNNTTTLDLSENNEGVYLIKIRTAGETITKKVVVSR